MAQILGIVLGLIVGRDLCSGSPAQQAAARQFLTILLGSAGLIVAILIAWAFWPTGGAE